uniref:Putative secreted protein n=1 Tax=Anopheles darlingi TaxID=43151 RepID=A0A2M4DAW3_ANODA
MRVLLLLLLLLPFNQNLTTVTVVKIQVVHGGRGLVKGRVYVTVCSLRTNLPTERLTPCNAQSVFRSFPRVTSSFSGAEKKERERPHQQLTPSHGVGRWMESISKLCSTFFTPPFFFLFFFCTTPGHAHTFGATTYGSELLCHFFLTLLLVRRAFAPRYTLVHVPRI